MMDKVALKPCPFCGEAAVSELDNVDKALRVYCSRCRAEMRVSYNDAALDDGSYIAFHEAVEWMDRLTEWWNERA